MRFFNRLVSLNFWLKVNLDFTIWGTLSKTTYFNRADIKSIRERYKKQKQINRHFIKDIQSEYHVSWCSMVLAIYRVCVEKGIDPEQAIDITDHVIFTNMQPAILANYIEKRLDNASDPFSGMVKSSKNQEKNFFGCTFKFYRPVENNNLYHLRVSDCMYNNYFQANKAPGLMKIACKWDMISWSMGIVPKKHGFIFKRPVTLGLDKKDCEFDFERIN